MTTRNIVLFLLTVFSFCLSIAAIIHLRRQAERLEAMRVSQPDRQPAVEQEAGVPDVPASQAAEAGKPFRTRSRIDFYTIVGPADGLIALGEVSAETRAAEKLDEGCATIPGRWVELREERDKYLLLRYFSGTPRMSAECPGGTTYLMEAAYYREMHDRYEAREEINP